MIIGAWDSIKLTCMEHGCILKPQPPTDVDKTPFYACPKYYPENRVNGEKMCKNIIPFTEAEKIVEQVIKQKEKYFWVCLKGFKAKTKKFAFEVTKHERNPKEEIFVAIKKIS